MAWVKWEKVLAPFEYGGLNIGSLKAFNLALILKCRWRYLLNPNDMWVMLIKSIHGTHFDSTVSHASSVWHTIVKTCSNVIEKKLLPTDVIRRKVGNGCNISFWNDIWCGKSSLRSRFHRLYHLDLLKEDTVADKHFDVDWKWAWSRQNLGSRNDQLLIKLRDEIGTFNPSDQPDTWTCSIAKDDAFQVKDVRNFMDRKLLPSSLVSTTWFKFLPKKVNIFLWRFRLDVLPVRWNLSAKDIDINSIVCPVCNNGIETRDHLLFDCVLASDIWQKVRVWLNCDIPFCTNWNSFITWIEGIRLQATMKDRIVDVFITTLWTIWRFRNGIVFQEPFCSNSCLFDFVRTFSFRWIKHRNHLVSTWNSWLSMPL